MSYLEFSKNIYRVNAELLSARARTWVRVGINGCAWMPMGAHERFAMGKLMGSRGLSWATSRGLPWAPMSTPMGFHGLPWAWTWAPWVAGPWVATSMGARGMLPPMRARPNNVTL